MHYGCHQDTKVMKLNFEFNLLLMDRKCSAHSQHESGLTFNRPALEHNTQNLENLGLLYLAGYNVLETVSEERQTQVWLTVQGIFLGALFLLGLAAVVLVCYCKRKLGVRIYQSRTTPNRTHVDFVEKESNQEMQNLFYGSRRSSSFTPSEPHHHLPTKGGSKGELLLKKAVDRAEKENVCLVPECSRCSDDKLVQKEHLNTQCAFCPENVFPHMKYNSPRVMSPDSGIGTSDFPVHKINGKRTVPHPPLNYL